MVALEIAHFTARRNATEERAKMLNNRSVLLAAALVLSVAPLSVLGGDGVITSAGYTKINANALDQPELYSLLTDGGVVITDGGEPVIFEAFIDTGASGFVISHVLATGDPAPPSNPSGLRLGTPAITTRGMKEPQARQIATFINRVAENIDDESTIEQVGKEALLLCSQFVVPEHFIIPNKDTLPASDGLTPRLF